MPPIQVRKDSLAQKRVAPAEPSDSMKSGPWLHLRTHHLWRIIKEVGLLSEDHLPQSMTQPGFDDLRQGV